MSLKQYQESISNELNTVATRVRQFVEHWGEDGRHHEAVLKSVIRKFLPKRYELGSGFVIKPNRERGDHKVTKQIDIIVYDSNYPTFFKEGDFIITTPDAVKAIISVKANLENQRTQSVYDDCNFNGRFIYDGKQNQDEILFNGLFSFDGYDGYQAEFLTIERNLQNSFDEYYDNQWVQTHGNTPAEERRYILNHIAINRDNFVKHWNSRFVGSQHYSFYKLVNLSYAYFISNLMEYLTVENETVSHDNFLWYPENKEQSKIKDFRIQRPR